MLNRPSRRQFIRQTAASGLAAGLLPRFAAAVWGAGQVDNKGITYHLPSKVNAVDQSVPSGLRTPFDWKVCFIPESDHMGTVLTWLDTTELSGPARFRIATALTGGIKKVEAYLPRNGRTVGVLDVRGPARLQPHEIELSSADTQEVLDQGLGLRVVEGDGFFIFDPAAATMPWGNHAQLPHLIQDDAADPLGEFYARMASYSVLQRFGWMQQCVFDGLLDLAHGFEDQGFRDAWEAQLEMFVDGQGNTKVEDVRGRPFDGKDWKTVFGVEDAGCSVFYELHSDQWAIADQGLKGVKEHAYGSGTTEGCYTIGYPLCIWGEKRGDDSLKDLGVKNLLARKENLRRTPETIRQRANGFPNWARGVAWYSLGFARSLDYLQGHPQYQAVADEVAACVQHARQYQRDDGLWDVFMHEDTGRDTSGSAGVAAACAMAARHGIETEVATEVAAAAFKGLQAYLRPDGLLGGAAPENTGGEALQRSGYRVIFPMAMGLMAQLAGTLA
ncbi:MAG: hypothetical protein EA424_06675, partial [Planctomycetaceae bacterium]